MEAKPSTAAIRANKNGQNITDAPASHTQSPRRSLRSANSSYCRAMSNIVSRAKLSVIVSAIVRASSARSREYSGETSGFSVSRQRAVSSDCHRRPIGSANGSAQIYASLRYRRHRNRLGRSHCASTLRLSIRGSASGIGPLRTFVTRA
jgi:hypothetical protein